MTGINTSASRKAAKQAKVIPGPRSLHRGISIHRNADSVRQFKANAEAKRLDHKDLLVHHQKINEELKDVYARTAALHKDNMTREERIEAQWKAFERVGGKRPQRVVGYKEHLEKISEEKKDERQRAMDERATSGEFVDYSKGSALHNAKDRRIKNFQQRQLKRAHMLRRFGDPTPLKQSGKFNAESATFTVFNKTIRKVQREVAHERRQHGVKGAHGGAGGRSAPGSGGSGAPPRRTMWDLRDRDDNLNNPSRRVVRGGDGGLDLGELRAAKRKRR